MMRKIRMTNDVSDDLENGIYRDIYRDLLVYYGVQRIVLDLTSFVREGG